ncbi:hypothetical protein A2966_03135 [Candidatus Roizmanbacteria bacterium RIFCSPLOWO2_01_FULL_41_22]|uniref:PEGA domain-containing protein n=1 Tax=Candidatus Roizmanbacteria bacterium RIFCSPLOWO2_01_FULL_41_22 TaxID=1802067 RepID=A0A1F7JAW5_9BACT|nr:MAG: hypothetical protein A2966_03135 [Candidatus Roizmanbacteria bacterium RIFCSPLOWO2_01_FULL_41_22]
MKKVLIAVSILAVLILATVAITLYGRGYRFSFSNGRADLSGTGLLVATSNPDGAQVFVNGHLTTATDNTINLQPGSYEVRIFKDGYFPWEKNLIIEKGVVAKAEALLFPSAPKLESITNIGVNNPVLDPSRTKIAYTVTSQAVRKNGVYVLDMTSRPILTLQNSSSQIADDTIALFSKAKLSWAPDGSNLLASTSAQNTVSNYLLQANTFNQSPSDITETLLSVNSSWNKIKEEKEKAILDGFPSKTRKLVMDNFNVISWSADETKILYQASSSATLPIIINPRLIGTNSTSEERSLEKNGIYVYDLKEDRNYKIHAPTDKDRIFLTWFPDSKHLIYLHDKKIDIMEYDGANVTKIFAGPFTDNFVFPWSDNSRIVILTNLGNSDIPPNLYTISLK